MCDLLYRYVERRPCNNIRRHVHFRCACDSLFRLLKNMQSTAGSAQVKLLTTVTFVAQTWWWSKDRQIRLRAIYSSMGIVWLKISQAVWRTRLGILLVVCTQSVDKCRTYFRSLDDWLAVHRSINLGQLPTWCTELFIYLFIYNIYINTLRTGSFKLFKRPFPGFLTILNL